jgi:cytochrome P450 PksS
MRDRVQALADELLTQMMHQGECDLIHDYALPLPMIIITEILGVPTRDRNKFHRWSKAVVSLSSPSPTLRVIPNVWMFLRYLRRFFERRRRDPQNDLATALITAEEAGYKLSGDELLAMVWLEGNTVVHKERIILSAEVANAISSIERATLRNCNREPRSYIAKTVLPAEPVSYEVHPLTNWLLITHDRATFSSVSIRATY